MNQSDNNITYKLIIQATTNYLFRFYTKGDVKGNIDEICHEASKYITQRETIIPVVLTKEIAIWNKSTPKKLKQ